MGFVAPPQLYMPTVATNQWTSSLNLQRLHQLGKLPLYVYGVNRYRVSRDFTSPLPLFTLSPFLISWEYHNHSSYFLFSFCPPTTSFHIPSPLSHLACALFYLLFWTPSDINNIQYRPWGQHFFSSLQHGYSSSLGKQCFCARSSRYALLAFKLWQGTARTG